MVFSAVGGYSLLYYSSVYKETVVLNTQLLPFPMNPPLTVIKMVHITITSFHTNLHANKSYILDD